MTNSQIYGRDARRSVENVAAQLERLAARIREIGETLDRGDGKASGHAADIVSEYTHGTGAVSTHLWGVVQNASDADIAYLRG